MGCGKSTLGKNLAKKLNLEFIDSDLEIEKMENLSISDIFQKNGENYFRDLEKEYLYSILDKKNILLSTGGGLPCFNNNIDLLKKMGTTFYLKLNAIELTKRIINSKTKRPLTINKKEDEVYSFVKKTLNEREKVYQQADYVLTGKNQTVKYILEILT